MRRSEAAGALDERAGRFVVSAVEGTLDLPYPVD